LDLTKVTDTGLTATLQGHGQPAGPGYNLKCAEQHTRCQLVPGGSGNPNLDLVNVQYRSPWIYSALSGKYGLSCDSNISSSQSSASSRSSASSAKSKRKPKKSKTKNSTSNVLVKTGKATVNGESVTVLTDANGLTLYYFTKDTLGNVACTTGCIDNWPPLLFKGTGAVKASKPLPGNLTTDTTVNGNQVLYNDHYLYTYEKDDAPRQAKGEGKGGGTWHAATPDLT